MDRKSLIIIMIVCVIIIVWAIGQIDRINRECEEISNEAGAFEYRGYADWSFTEFCKLKICELNNGKFVCHEEIILMEERR